MPEGILFFRHGRAQRGHILRDSGGRVRIGKAVRSIALLQRGARVRFRQRRDRHGMWEAYKLREISSDGR